MPRKISNSAVYDTEEERRPVAVNKRHVRPKPIPIDKASFALELLNNQTRPTVNIVGTRHFHEDPTPLDKNYPIEIELQRMAMSAVPDKPQQPLKTKSPFTEDMIEKYREEERRGILQRGYNVPPELEVLDLEPEVEIPDAYKNYETALRRMDASKVEATLLYDRAKKNVPIVMKQIKDLDDKYNSLMSDPKRRVRMGGIDRKIYLEDEYIKEKQQLEQYLDTLQTDMRNLQEEIQMTQTDMEQMKQDKKDLFARETNVKRANAQKIKNAEDQIRLLNTTLPIQQMVGEPDEVYRQRLIALRVPVDNSRVDATEARIYEHKLFKRNLKKLIDLPLHQVENIIKTLDLNDMERTYQLNEIFPKVETEFIKVFGRKPLLRNPEQSLTDFFVNLLEAPLLAQEQSEAITSLADQQSVSAGQIDPRVVGLRKADVLKLLKEAGFTKGKSQEFQRKTVKQLKMFYTAYLQNKPPTEQEMMGAEDIASREESKAFNKRKKYQMDRLIARIEEYEKEMEAEQRESEKILKRQDKAQRKQERGMMGEEEKQTRMFMKEEQRQKEEYDRLIEAQKIQAQKEEARKQKKEQKKSKSPPITPFLTAKKK